MFQLGSAQAADGANSSFTIVRFALPWSTTLAKMVMIDQTSYGSAGNQRWSLGGAYNGAAYSQAWRGVRLLMSTGNIATGTFKLYGVVK